MVALTVAVGVKWSGEAVSDTPGVRAGDGDAPCDILAVAVLERVPGGEGTKLGVADVRQGQKLRVTWG